MVSSGLCAPCRSSQAFSCLLNSHGMTTPLAIRCRRCIKTPCGWSEEILHIIIFQYCWISGSSTGFMWPPASVFVPGTDCWYCWSGIAAGWLSCAGKVSASQICVLSGCLSWIQCLGGLGGWLFCGDSDCWLLKIEDRVRWTSRLWSYSAL